MVSRGMPEGSTLIKYSAGHLAGTKFASKTLEDFVWTSENDYVREVVFLLVGLDKWEKGIGFVGDVGVGKTHLLAALYKNRVWRALYHGGDLCVWVWFRDLVGEALKDRQFLREFVSEYDLFFVDDVWSIGASLDEKNVLRELVLRLYDAGKVFSYTANSSFEEWDIDERVRDRLREMVLELRVSGTSYREILRHGMAFDLGSVGKEG